MRIATVWGIALALLAAPGRADGPKKDGDNLEGTWVVTSSEDGGEKVAGEVGGKVVISADKITLVSGGTEEAIGYTLDPSKAPKWIDLADGKKTYLGIYELDGDTLKICFPESGKGRATKFESKPDGLNDRLIVLKRAK